MNMDSKQDYNLDFLNEQISKIVKKLKISDNSIDIESVKNDVINYYKTKYENMESDFFKMDVHDKQTRSYNMSQIKSKNTKPEEMVCKYLFSHGFRYRKNDKRYPGKPDIVLPKYKTVIFVNGCFWHKHEGCRYFVVPKSNTEFWMNKINRNVERDADNTKKLINMGWKVVTVWECELKKDKRDDTLSEIIFEIEKQYSH